MKIVEIKTNSQIIQCHCAGNFKLPVEDWQMPRTNRQLINRNISQTVVFDLHGDTTLMDKI
ncbi:MAG: hypothetical protein JZU53_15500 [Paludibacter sp.]|nr:hypothetical protein [Paludibacter sp.]